MAKPPIFKRKPFFNRPWLDNAIWDKLSRRSVLHLDAWVKLLDKELYLIVDFRAGGATVIARDAWLIDTASMTLTQVWDANRPHMFGSPVTWTAQNNAWMRRVHATVHKLGDDMMVLTGGEYTRLSSVMHYIHIGASDTEPGPGSYKPPVRKAFKICPLSTPSEPAPKRPRGRPRKDSAARAVVTETVTIVRNGLPDIL